MTTTITVCDTCRYSDEEKLRDGETAGARFATEVETAARGVGGIEVRRFSCLMGCERHCNAAISAPGKVTYMLGNFAPASEDAAALVAYAEHYDRSGSGIVPYRVWPQGVKGHFVARIPPLAQ